MRHYRGVSCLLSHLYGVHCLCECAYLVQLDEYGVSYAFLDALFENLGIRYEEEKVESKYLRLAFVVSLSLLFFVVQNTFNA